MESHIVGVLKDLVVGSTVTDLRPTYGTGFFLEVKDMFPIFN